MSGTNFFHLLSASLLFSYNFEKWKLFPANKRCHLLRSLAEQHFSLPNLFAEISHIVKDISIPETENQSCTLVLFSQVFSVQNNIPNDRPISSHNLYLILTSTSTRRQYKLFIKFSVCETRFLPQNEETVLPDVVQHVILRIIYVCYCRDTSSVGSYLSSMKKSSRLLLFTVCQCSTMFLLPQVETMKDNVVSRSQNNLIGRIMSWFAAFLTEIIRSTTRSLPIYDIISILL